MRIRVHHLGVAAALVLAGCSGDDNGGAPSAPPSALTCGAGTVQQNNVCVALVGDSGAPLVSDASVVQCGPGTILQGNACVLPPAASITKARLTYLNLLHDVAKPVFLNNPIPIRFGITSNSPDPAHPVSTPVTVVFSFVEAAPADPTKPGTCSSNGMVLNLAGDGVEQKFEDKVFPTDDCAFVKANTLVNVSVDFDPGLKQLNTPTTIDYPPVVFSTAHAAAPDNQLCRKTGSAGAPNAGTGCVYPLLLAPTPVGADGKPMVNVTFDDLAPVSSVALLAPTAEDPQVPAGKHESNEPALVVNATFSLNGRDPYEVPIDTSKLPADFVAADPTIATDLKYGLNPADYAALDDLPAAPGGAPPAYVRYDIVATDKLASSAWLPLTIDDPSSPDPDVHVLHINLTELEPGTENGFTHALYIEGQALAAVTGAGVWAKEDSFTVRGCLVADFTEGGESPDGTAEDDPAGGDVPNGDCHTFPVRLVKVPSPTTSGSAESFDTTWSRTVGKADRLALTGALSTSNSLDLAGARTETNLTVDLKGKIGREFGVNLVTGHAKGAAVTALGSSYIDVGLDAFGTNLFGFQNSTVQISFSKDFTLAKSFDFPVLAYGFGPVSIGITASVGGNLGLNTALNVSASVGGDSTVAELNGAVANGLVQGTITPSAGLTGSVSGGIKVFIASAVVVASVQVIELGTPVSANLRWGVTTGTLNPDTQEIDQVTQMTVLGNLTWDLTINWLNVSVDVTGRLFGKSKTFNIFKYNNPQETINLLNRSLGGPIVLE